MGNSTKILLVEDDRYIALALKIRLQSEGFDVKVVGGCKAALSSAFSYRPDIAVLDYNLPDGNGLALMQMITQEYQQTPVGSIVMSASKMPGLCEQAKELGAIEFFEKPFRSADLIESIARFQSNSEPGCVA
ncbi:MAG: response regulator transcription factor [Granulosicoccus sp.]